MALKDAKVKKQFSVGLVEEVMTKRPFNRFLTLMLLTETEFLRTCGWFDLPKLARECLKTLTSEDLRQTYNLDQHDRYKPTMMNTFENVYCNISAPGLEGELSKIMLRYKKEGYPHRVASPAAPLPEEVALNASVNSLRQS